MYKGKIICGIYFLEYFLSIISQKSVTIYFKVLVTLIRLSAE